MNWARASGRTMPPAPVAARAVVVVIGSPVLVPAGAGGAGPWSPPSCRLRLFDRGPGRRHHRRRALQDEVGDEGRPAGLVRSAESRAGVAVEVLVERNEVVPRGV